MSIGQRFENDEVLEASLYELYSVLGERDTPKLFEQSFKLDTSHDWPAGGGNSLDRKTKYIDRLLYQEVMDGEFKATGLSPQQIIDRWLDHEHCEICISQGDNAVDTYLPCHRRALRSEHIGVLAILGRDNPGQKIKKYESIIWPGLVRCYARNPKNPPKDGWCGVYLDDPDERDEEILGVMARLGVIDAQKRSKYDTHYGVGGEHCRDCSMWKPDLISSERGSLAACAAVSGLVRDNRHCDLWMPARGAATGRSESSPMNAGAKAA